MNFPSQYIVIDIETVAPSENDEKVNALISNKLDKRLKDKEKIEENKKKVYNSLALDPYLGQILMIGIKSDNNYVLINQSLVDRELDLNFIEDRTVIQYYPDEKALLEEFNSSINEYIANGGVLITFNGKEFDLPYIFIRSVINNTEYIIPSYLDLIHRYSHNMHFDLYNILDKSLSDIAIAFNLNFDNISGNAIGDLYSAKKYEEIVSKNVKDLNYTKEIFDRMFKWIGHKLRTTL